MARYARVHPKERAMPMHGFDPEFESLPHYIIEITRRIWEERGIDLIRRWYADDCVMHTPGGPARGIDAVVAGTLETLNSFPDRRLLPDDIIWSGDAAPGFLSSHRVASVQRHRGDGVFGPPTGRTIRYRTIADCECRNGRITEEWLVRDNAAIAQQVGLDLVAHAASLAAADDHAGRAPWQTTDAAEASRSGARTTDMRADPLAAELIGRLASIWNEGRLRELPELYAEAVNWHGPRNESRLGPADIDDWLVGYLAAFPGARWEADHAVVLREPDRPVRVALRWRLSGTHAGRGVFGAPSGAKILILAVSHFELLGGRIARDFTLIDELALWKQIKRHTG
jgi:predicted ester cyclase